MSVTTTPRTIVNAAYATNAENRPEYIATGETELLDVVSRGMRKLYALAASLNPTYFGTTGDVAFAAGGWTRPEDAEAVFRIEDSDDEEVLVVPFDDRTLYGGDPAAVYFLGRKFYGAGNQGDPTSGTLTFWYSRRPHGDHLCDLRDDGHIVSGQMANDTINDGVTVDLRFGTGTPPVNGAAVTGTLVGIEQTRTSLVAAARGGFTVQGRVTGLSIATAYWVDISLKRVTGGTATVTGVTCTTFEV